MMRKLRPPLTVIENDLFRPSDTLLQRWKSGENLPSDLIAALQSDPDALARRDALESADEDDYLTGDDIDSPPVPPRLLKDIQARVAARARDFSTVPTPGQILRIDEVRGPTGPLAIDLPRPLAVLISEPVETPEIWYGWLATAESDYAGYWDLLLGPEDDPCDPLARMIQLWNPVHVYIPSTSIVLAQLTPARLAAVRALAVECAVAPEPDRSLAQPGEVITRSVDSYSLRTGTPLGDRHDPRHRYQRLYFEAARLAIIEPAQLALAAPSPLQQLIRTLRHAAERVGLDLTPYRPVTQPMGETLDAENGDSFTLGGLARLHLQEIPDSGQVILDVVRCADSDLVIVIRDAHEITLKTRLDVANPSLRQRIDVNQSREIAVTDPAGNRLFTCNFSNIPIAQETHATVTQERGSDAWLWSEATGVRWWTPENTHLLPAVVFDAKEVKATFQAEPDGRAPLLMATTLAPELRELLNEWLDRSTPPARLHLGEDLPLQWQEIPFERLNYQGQPLGDRLQVVRFAPADVAPPVFPRSHEAIILDLWPDDERLDHSGRRLFSNLLDHFERGQVLRGWTSIAETLPTLDLTAASLLCVICHGSEGEDAKPLRIAPGQYAALPSDGGLPPLVILLICGDEEGEMLRYGQTLLTQGASTVLAPVGRLEAPAADSFIREFLQGWQTGRTVSDLLWDAQRHSESDFGARQFRLVGQAQLHQGPACAVFDLPDEALAEKALDDGQALLILLERITRRAYRNDGNLESVVDDLYEGLHLQYDERDAESKLLKKLDAVHEQLRPLTARWVVPFIVYLAEVYDHTLLPKYEALRVAQAQDVEENAPPYIFHYWGKLYYRQGHYGQALDEVIKGIERVGDQRICAPAGVGLLGLLVNCLIDLNVPSFGLMLYDRLDACLSQAGDRLSQLQKINRLDRRARLALRLGAPEQAMMYLQRKHEIDHRDPARELAGLLYASAWGFENLGAEARKYALEAGALLRQHDNPLSQLGRGNETLAYLLRAYALWAWRAKDREAFDWLVKALEPVQRRLTFHDPGPLGFTMAFLHLYRQEHAIEASGLLRWEVAESALEPFEYWLELAIFSCLLNRPQQANRFLGRFQQMRLETNNAVRRLPSWLIFDQHTSWQKEMEDRDALERKLLLGDAPPAVVDMVQVGLIAL